MNQHPPLRSLFCELGERGVFASLASPATLREGCAALEAHAYDAATKLGPLLSVIAHAGLGLPILEHAVVGDSSAPVVRDATLGRHILAVAITEREAGSDVMSMRTTLTKECDQDGTLVLNGSKWHITNAPIADAFVVFAQDETTADRFLSAVLVRPEDVGVRRGPPLDLIGCDGSPTGEIHFDNVRLPADRKMAKSGARLLDLAFLRERCLAPWPLLGKMARVIDDCLDHVDRREQFGKPIHEFQFVQEKILSSFSKMLEARQLAERAIAGLIESRPEPAIASLAKATAADAAAHVFRAAIEVHGSYGVQAERRYGEYLNDAMCAQIAGGTRETHKKIVFGALRFDRARSRRGYPSTLVRCQ